MIKEQQPICGYSRQFKQQHSHFYWLHQIQNKQFLHEFRIWIHLKKGLKYKEIG